MKVSVCMITYNHEKYIKQAIDSILMQKCNFDYEIIIGEDCSFDNTTNIIQEFHSKYPDKIVPVLRKENIRMLPNFIDVLQKAKGKYIALLEGDDYWTDPLKLQKQVDFLEANPDYVLCSHNGTILDEIGTGKTGEKLIKTDKDFDFNTEDLLIQNRASTLTVMFRNGLIKEFPEWYTKFSGGDRSLYIILSQYGKLRHLEFDGAVYRLNFGGVSNLRRIKTDNNVWISHYKNRIRANNTFNKFLKYKYNKLIDELNYSYALKLFELYFANKDYKNAHSISKEFVLKLSNKKPIKLLIKVLYVKIFRR